MLESFSQKLGSDSEILSLQNQRTQKVTNFIFSLKITLSSAVLFYSFTNQHKCERLSSFWEMDF